jgi:HlyD family secretion protein
MRWLKRTIGVLMLILAVAAALWFAWPQPVPVDLATVTRGPMEVTVEDEGKTRVRHIYTVSAPISGTVLRISHPADHHETSLHVGDAVTAEETVVAVMRPASPGFLDVRSRVELQAAVAAAEAAVNFGRAEVRRIEAALDFARQELRRAETLRRTDTIPEKALDKARFDVDTNEAVLASAKAQLEVRRGELALARARLIEPANDPAPGDPSCCIAIRSPVSGHVLKIIQESEAVVATGAPLIEIGDPRDLEIVAELLSADAVRIEPGASALIEGWGGPPIRGQVSRIEPAGFLKVSALGIEEQRVRTIIDFADASEDWSRLGHDFRVNLRVTVWQADDVLAVPVSALFRTAGSWTVFVVSDGRARTRPVEIGQRNNRLVEVVSGLAEREQVVLHPSDRVSDDTAVTERRTR